MIHAEEKAAKAAISRKLAREYTRKSQSVQNRDLANIYANIALMSDGENAAVNGAKEALYELRRISDRCVQENLVETDLREWKKLNVLRNKLQTLLNKRIALCEQYGVSASVGM